MPLSTTITCLDLSSGVPDVRVSVGYVWSVVGPPNPGERKQDEETLDIATAALTAANPIPFAYTRSLLPAPSPIWDIGMWIQEIPRIANGTGWLFRSGRLTTEPPPDPIEVILAREELLGNAELAGAVGPLPSTSGSTTITALTLLVSGVDVAIMATGTDTGLPVGVTFNFSATLTLIPNGSIGDLDPFETRLTNVGLTFTAGVGTGLSTALLNLISGIILGEVAPRLRATIKGLLNAGVLSSVATQINRGVPAAWPTGVVLSIRRVRATTRTTAGAPEPVIGVFASLGAFGGVRSKFPALSGGTGTCFIATAACGPDAAEVVALRAWRDGWLRRRRGGAALIAAYERVSPLLARLIGRSSLLRAAVRWVVVKPAAALVDLGGDSQRSHPCGRSGEAPPSSSAPVASGPLLDELKHLGRDDGDD